MDTLGVAVTGIFTLGAKKQGRDCMFVSARDGWGLFVSGG